MPVIAISKPEEKEMPAAEIRRRRDDETIDRFCELIETFMRDREEDRRERAADRLTIAEHTKAITEMAKAAVSCSEARKQTFAERKVVPVPYWMFGLMVVAAILGPKVAERLLPGPPIVIQQTAPAQGSTS